MRRELSATTPTGEQELVVESIGDGRFAVTLDGTRHEVDALEVRPGSWSLIVGGRAVRVDLDRTKAGGLVASATTGELGLELDDARRKRLAKATAGGRPKPAGEELRAPIAGRVVKVLVAVGDVVAAGAGVVVLEAMKMENEIKAERGGTVAALHVSAGQPVDTQALLLVLT
jgi:biotin carboxyl carrier protein